MKLLAPVDWIEPPKTGGSIDSVSNITEIANPTADVSTDEITLAAEIPSAPMTTIAELTTISEETATTTEVPSTLSVSTGDPTFTVLAVNPSTETTTLAAETSILNDQPTVDTLKNSINEATTAGEIIPSSEPADGETLTSISTIRALDALEMIVTVAPKQMSILDAAAELTSVPIESTIPVLETTVVAAVEPPAGTLFDDLSIEAVPVVPSAETASTLTQDAVILAEEKTTDVNMITTLTTVSAIPIESTTAVTVPSTKTPASAKTASTLTEDAAFPAKEKTTDVNIRITLTTKSAIPIETTTDMNHL
ncbi:hypothetical protein DAPPUDRAFT_270755 [Daphnia pulex]|uniref:Uncharacterized protein n=1 Tax=Daphnia pulex TaxID=6669 RepID=E9I193_DAPPU|nr:hypothetical protein DAPPUDRAFT_270755 [Daphnia pulex]|eukprot:EFX62237.1 hypothetical protein DAPPUDRAFT_270755 [Daphnia pulex]